MRKPAGAAWCVLLASTVLMEFILCDLETEETLYVCFYTEKMKDRLGVSFSRLNMLLLPHTEFAAKK